MPAKLGWGNDGAEGQGFSMAGLVLNPKSRNQPAEAVQK